MQVKTISTTYGRKVNLGNYESAHVEVSIWADLDDGENEAQAAELLRQMARNNVMAEVARVSPEFAKKLNGKLAELPMGLMPLHEMQINMSNYDEALDKKRQLIAERNRLDMNISALETSLEEFGESMRDEDPHDFFSNYPDNG